MKITQLIVCLIATPVALLAQTREEFKVDSLRLTRQYQPTLAEAVKFQLKPELPQFDAERPKFQYKPIQNLTPGDFKPNPIGLSKSLIDPVSIQKSNRLTVGYGTYNTPFLGVNLNTTHNKNWDLGLNARHFNSSGSVEREGITFRNVNYGETFAGIHGHLISKNWRYSGSVSYDRQAIRYYGVDSTGITGFSGLAQEAASQYYNLFTIQADASKQPVDSLGRGLVFSAQSHLLDDKRGQAEQQFQFNGQGRTVFAEQLIEWNIKYFFSRYQGVLQGISRNLIELSPRYVLGEKQWQAGLGLRMVYLNDSIDNKFRLFPDIYFNWSGQDRRTNIGLVFQGDVYINTFYGLMAQSPFIGPDPRLLNSPQLSLKLFANHRMSSNSSISMAFNYHRRDNWLFFKNIGPELTPDYDPATTQISAEARYNWQLNEDLKLEAGLRYQHFNLDTMQVAWQTPRWLVDAKFKYRIQEKWQLSVETSALEGISALNLTAQKVTFPWLFDLSSRVTYKYNKQATIFVSVLNLASMRYIRWYNYPSYGLQILAGLSIQL